VPKLAPGPLHRGPRRASFEQVIHYLVPFTKDVERVRRRPQIGLLSAVLGLIAALLVAFPDAGASTASGREAVATESATATRAAMRILQTGGNAVDAAVTAALVAGVASPSSSGIGGGGFALVWTAATAKVTALDFRETAPKAVDANALERRPLPSPERGKLVGVPGEVAGLAELHRRFGRRPWAEVVLPAVRVAEEGYPVSEHLAHTITTVGASLAVDDELAALFSPGGRPRAVGVQLKNPRLAQTLRRLSAEGPRAIYEGTVAANIASRVSSAGGALTTKDLAAYRPVERRPLLVKWEGYDVYTMGPPSAGGVALAETLGSLNRAELRELGRESGAYQHLIAEILRGALADRMRFLGDPDYEHLNVQKLLDPERLAKHRRAVSLDRTRPAPAISSEEHGTHHLVTADADGNVVSLTTTVNTAFGAILAEATTGIVLNDELDDFTTRATAKDFGLTQSPNRPRARARPVSSMTPTIVLKNGSPVLALGGSGGMAIAPNVIEVLLSSLVFDEPPSRAVSLPRFGIPLKGGTIALDAHATASLRKDLESRGETVSTESSATHAIQLIAIQNGRKTPAADPRKGGSALAE
jgi:gamma-glutamyltranspeptidase/glutathione hydrolase